MKKYGAEAPSLPRELIYAQTENYVEYSRDGQLLHGQEQKMVARSKYEEDVYRNNHTSVWGSYWENGEWGYACCKQTVRNSYCTGAAGRQAKESMMKEMMEKIEAERARATEGQEGSGSGSGDGNGEESNALVPRGKKTKEEKLKEEQDKLDRLTKALKAEEEKAGEYVEKDERKRGYNALAHETYEVSEEEMEAYRMKKMRSEDPMRAFAKTQAQTTTSASAQPKKRMK